MMPSNMTNLRNYLEGKGFNEYEIVPFFMDMLQYMTRQEDRTKTGLNTEMENLGWGIEVIDETIYSSVDALINEPVSKRPLSKSALIYPISASSENYNPRR